MANEDKATRYQRLQRRASIAAVIAVAAVLALMLLSGGAVSLRRSVASAVGGSFVLTIVAYAAALGLLLEGVQLPFAYYQGITLERLKTEGSVPLNLPPDPPYASRRRRHRRPCRPHQPRKGCAGRWLISG